MLVMLQDQTQRMKGTYAQKRDGNRIKWVAYFKVEWNLQMAHFNVWCMQCDACKFLLWMSNKLLIIQCFVILPIYFCLRLTWKCQLLAHWCILIPPYALINYCEAFSLFNKYLICKVKDDHVTICHTTHKNLSHVPYQESTLKVCHPFSIILCFIFTLFCHNFSLTIS